MKKFFFIFVLCVLIQGCVTSSTTTLKLNPQPLTGQVETAQGGVDAVVSEKTVRVTVRPYKDTYSSDELVTFMVSVYSADKSFDFTAEDVKAFVDGKPHRILTYAEIESELKDQRKWAIRKAEVKKDTKMQQASGARDLQNIINQELEEEIDTIEENTKKRLLYFDTTTLRSKSVVPGKQVSGNVTLEKISDPATPKLIKLVVTAGGEKHEFSFEQTAN